MHPAALLAVFCCTLLVLVDSISPIVKQGPVYAVTADELVLRLRQNAIHQPEVFERAVTVLDSYKTSAVCHRIAVMSLIDDCQALGQSNDVEHEQVGAREIFATRLATCELSSTDVIIPKDCQPFVPHHRHCEKNRKFSWPGSSFSFKGSSNKPEKQETDIPCYPETNQRQLRSCITSLRKESQTWTSYSNSLQNIAVVCQASRGAAEKDEVLEVYRSATSKTSEVTAELHNILAKSAQFSSEIELVRKQSRADWERHLDEVASRVGGFLDNFNKAFQSMVNVVGQGVASTTESMEKLQDKVKDTHDIVADGNDKIHDVQANALKDANNHNEAINRKLLQLEAKVAESEKVAHLALQRLENMSTSANQTAELIDQNNASLVEQSEYIKSQVPAAQFWSAVAGILLTVTLENFFRNRCVGALSAFLVVATYAFLKHAARDPLDALYMALNYDEAITDSLSKLMPIVAFGASFVLLFLLVKAVYLRRSRSSAESNSLAEKDIGLVI